MRRDQDLDFPEPPLEGFDEVDEMPPIGEAAEPAAAFERFAWNQPRDLALLRLALAGGKSAAELAEDLAGRPEFAGTWLDPAEVAKRVGVLRAEVAPEGLKVPRLRADRYRPSGAKLAAALKAVDRRGEV